MALIIGNTIAFIASLLMVYSGVLKEKKKILYAQTLQILLMAISDLILGGFTGTLINIINVIRNILCYKDKLGLREQIILTILAVVISFAFNNVDSLGLLPVIAAVIYIWFINVKDVKKFKMLIAFTTLLWLIYDFSIKSYTASLFDLSNIIANVVTIFQIKKGKKHGNKKNK